MQNELGFLLTFFHLTRVLWGRLRCGFFCDVELCEGGYMSGNEVVAIWLAAAIFIGCACGIAGLLALLMWSIRALFGE
ncbi:hypothetical protein DRN74_06645 [Candidatus Micrarchaeota archaeon]|nr:MAG: hypothetical protein DRN74_06645 [Candidatus Micrarchaeota archaeon]